MAKTLAQLSAGEKSDDREFALNFLREMVKQSHPYPDDNYAARALAELGDTSSLDIFYQEGKSWLEHPGRSHNSGVALYLCKHGGRREWELLHAISLSELGEGKQPGTGIVWASVMKNPRAYNNPYAIPILGLALSQTGYAGRRLYQDGGQSYSYGEKACEMLEKYAGTNFGYQRKDEPDERLKAVKQAQAWWNNEGKRKYTFDFIEKEMGSAGSDRPRSE